VSDKVILVTAIEEQSMQEVINPQVKQVAEKRGWTEAENSALRAAVAKFGEKNWKKIAEHVPGRNNSQCIQRWRKALDPTLTKGCWTPTEDQLLIGLLGEIPKGSWAQIANRIPGRCGRQCRDRWNTALDPRVDRSSFKENEDAILKEQIEKLGNQWSKIAMHLPRRTPTQVRDRWRIILRRYRKALAAHDKREGKVASTMSKCCELPLPKQTTSWQIIPTTSALIKDEPIPVEMGLSPRKRANQEGELGAAYAVGKLFGLYLLCGSVVFHYLQAAVNASGRRRRRR
jgi:hypothetical protein